MAKAKKARATEVQPDPKVAKQKLTASEAIYAFCAWLTTRHCRTVMSATDDTAPIAELVGHFCCVNNLAKPRNEYTELFTMPQDAPPQAVDPATQIDVLYITTDYGKKFTCRTVKELGIFVRNYKKAHPNIGLTISQGRMTEGEYSKVPLDEFFVDKTAAAKSA